MTRREYMTVQEFCDELGIGRGTWESWRRRGVTPRYRKLFNGRIVILRSDADAWFDALPGGGLAPGNPDAIPMPASWGYAGVASA